MKYKVHYTYISYNGVLIQAGLYDVSEIDLAEARYKSIVTLENTDQVKVEIIESVEKSNIDNIDKIVINPDKSNSTDTYNKSEDNLSKIKLTPNINKTTITKIFINKISEQELITKKIKYIGKATVGKLLAERSVKEFDSYIDLDNRVPLAVGKNWEDIIILDFSKTVENSENKLIFE